MLRFAHDDSSCPSLLGVAADSLVAAAGAFALTPAQALAIAAGENDSRIEALNAAVARGDERLAAFVQAMLDDEVKVAGDKVFIVHDGKTTRRGQRRCRDAARGRRGRHQQQPDAWRARGRARRPARALARRRRAPRRRRRARQGLARRIVAAAGREGIRRRDRSRAEGPARAHARDHPGLVVRPQPSASPPPPSWRAATRARSPACSRSASRPMARPMPKCESRCSRRCRPCAIALAWGERLAVVFTGISLGSVLLLVALGLAITYGLMGVINMAHGELMMIGAYTTYVVQNLFRAYLPGVFDAYVLAAIPAAFLVSARSRRDARARRDPLPLRPAARDAARDLGHQPGPAAGGALDLRRAERAGREPELALRRRRDHEQPGPAVQPDRDHRLRLHRPRRRRPADRQDALRPLHPRRHAEPAHGVVRRRRHREDRHAGVLVRRRHRRPRRRRALADRQRRPRPRPELHRRLVPGRRPRRRRPARRHRRRRRSASASSTSCSRASPARCWRRSRCSSSSSSSSRGSRRGCSR